MHRHLSKHGRVSPSSLQMLCFRARLRVLRALTRIPPLTNEELRARILAAYWEIKWKRTRLAERLGWVRYSRPALAGIDVRLAEVLGDRRVFVEAGANDGYRQSNTYYLERFHGWTGVLVEPIPQLASLARKRRRKAHVFSCALVGNNFSADVVTLRHADLISGIGSEVTETNCGWHRTYDVEVPARTLTSVVEEAGLGHIDLLSLDVEGYEASVLDGLDLDRFRPRFVLLQVLGEDVGPLRSRLPGCEVRQWLTQHDVLFEWTAAGKTPRS